MNRRGFLSFLGAAVAGATLDPERLLFVPGRKLISIPAPSLSNLDFEYMAELYIRPAVVRWADDIDQYVLGRSSEWVPTPELSVDQAFREMNVLIDRWGQEPFRI